MGEYLLQGQAMEIGVIKGMSFPTKVTELEADALSRYTSLKGYVDEEKEKQYEVEWSTDPVVENVATTAETPLTIHTITSLTYPTGATEVRVILLPMIKASAQAAATHHIGIKILYEVNDGGWNTLKDFTANPPMSLAGDGAVDSWAYPIDISAIVSSGDKLELRFTVTSDNAGSVNYTTSFLVVLVYKMG